MVSHPCAAQSVVSFKTPKSPTSLSLSTAVSTVTATSTSETAYTYVAQGRMPTYFQAALTEAQIAIFFVSLIQFIIDMALGFNVEFPSTPHYGSTGAAYNG
jgi:hypothetical protein